MGELASLPGGSLLTQQAGRRNRAVSSGVRNWRSELNFLGQPAHRQLPLEL